MELYERKILKEIEKLIDKKTIIVVTGMRRVGKTTLFNIIFNKIKSDNKVFLDIENPIIQKIFQEDNYDNILLNLKSYGIDSTKKVYIFLDEIQAMPSIVKSIKYLSDHYDLQFFLTGSSSFYFKGLFPESLAGRKTIFELFPLDFEEFLIFKNIKKEFYNHFKDKENNKNYIDYQKIIKAYEEYLEYGGFPQVVLAESIEEKKQILQDIFKSYFEKEVRFVSDFKEIDTLRDFILILMPRAGSKISISKISSELGITRRIAHSYLSFLEATYFISLITPFSRSMDREISGTKKVYFCDTGLLNNLAKLSSGAILENAVFNCLRTKGKINYYQRRSGAEIDFILNELGVAIEVKERGTIFDREKILKMLNDLNLKEGYVISKSFVKDKGFICASDI